MSMTNFAKGVLGRMGLVCARSHRAADIDLFDLLVRAEMRKRAGADFFFLQVGANDGELHDPIRKYVDEFRWRGLLVEPIPSLFAQLKVNYAAHPQLLFENCAIGSTKGTMTLYKVPEARVTKAYARGLASFNPNVLLKHKDLGLGLADLERVEVPSMPIDAMLEKNHIKQVDLLQIDTEGFDYEVLKLFNFKAMKPTLVQFEHVHLKLADQMGAFELLRGHGYQVSTTQVDTIGYGAGGDTSAK